MGNTKRILKRIFEVVMESVVNIGVVLVAAVVMTCLEYLHMRWIKRKLRASGKLGDSHVR